ncbi:hypothetical protein L226DRAFT_250692 [Lentinus tigrinus ALCF2SS1-7]|nr:hypothetical protein L226DRAFT_250692 [Lentinus tigrinus ALCF2SS1-7]
MTCLSRMMHLPPKLRKAKATNPLNRYKQVGPFIFWNLSHALLSPPHYETSMYGAANAYLSGIFPLDRYFMIKPQGMIRPLLDAEAAVGNATVQSKPSLAVFSASLAKADKLLSDTNEGGTTSALEGVQEDDEDDAAANILDTSIGSYLGGHLARGQGK